MFKSLLFILFAAMAVTLSAATAEYARIDCILGGPEARELKVVDRGRASPAERQEWMKKQNIHGIVACFKALPEWKNDCIIFNAVGNGNFDLQLMGPDVRIDGKRVPAWLEFESVKINGKEFVPAGQTVRSWHNRRVRYRLPVKDGDAIKVKLKFRAIKDN